MGQRQTVLSSDSKSLGDSGGKSFSIIKDWNLLFLVRLWFTKFSEFDFWTLWLFELVFCLIFADKFNLWAFPITAFLETPPIFSAKTDAVKIPHEISQY